MSALVVFDLDGTLIHGDCGGALVRRLIARHSWRRIAALLIAPVAMPMMMFPRTRRRGVSAFLWLGTVGVAPALLDATIARFIADYPLRELPSARAALENELAQGHRVVVATGALRVLAEGFLQRLGVGDRVLVAASRMTRFAGGQIASVQCNGHEKLRELQRLGLPTDLLRAYSDTWSDFPLFDAAATPIVINASARDLRRLQSRYGERLQMLAS
ncbi:HAD-IB family phosphatase [Arenimonas oryziterrae]|uniref:Haloacid dehalogenase n=1 Tax=Arenimonas oryziterrae DSM 21050 = YC6267 TaxID=1121015 RepID=A0A091B0C1_9GAMM|nr:HAD-IB family phosphatase [Arenimonas oryziterrae]KFN44987.1 hypothetical protein N789_02920 [Arenimonas oryziterrae DSM 21050 = YC6267]